MKYSVSPNTRLVLLIFGIPLVAVALLAVFAPKLLAWKIQEARDYVVKTWSQT